VANKDEKDRLVEQRNQEEAAREQKARMEREAEERAAQARAAEAEKREADRRSWQQVQDTLNKPYRHGDIKRAQGVRETTCQTDAFGRYVCETR
jgi:hypothetical protein